MKKQETLLLRFKKLVCGATLYIQRTMVLIIIATTSSVQQQFPSCVGMDWKTIKNLTYLQGQEQMELHVCLVSY